MTVQEAIEHARKVARDKRADADWKWRHGRLNADDCISCAEEHEQLAEWLEELEQYRALGTVEELKEAREKQVAKKVIVEDDGNSLLCPSCGLELMGSINYPDHDPYYCFECGQALKWGEEDD